MMSIFNADEVTVLVWQVIAPINMDPIEFSARVYSYPFTDLARLPNSTTAEVRVAFASSSLQPSSSLSSEKCGRVDDDDKGQSTVKMT
jgi:hypothetical protein